MSLLPLFLVSLAAVGLETALTRYFALASWSDYGYWVISIVMVCFAFSGVTLALGRDTLVRHGALLLAALPALLVASAGLGYAFTILNPFNPLQLQNPVTYLPQLGNIGAVANKATIGGHRTPFADRWEVPLLRERRQLRRVTVEIR